jgi:arginine utilization protein RocB
MLRTFLSAVLVVAFAQFGTAETQSPSQYQQLGQDIFKELVETKSTESGVGSTPAAEAVARRLLAAGFAPGDVVVIGPNERKKNLVARINGKGAGKPILLLAHLDVVEARREDWSNLDLQFDKKRNAIAESECTTRQVALFHRSPRSLHGVEASNS